MEHLTRHTIVLAEEKETIRRLVKKAVETKPLGQEKIKDILTVTDDVTLVETLSRSNSPVSILLLSTTFSTRSHQSLISNIAERHPGIKVISLTHKYGDRSSMDYGAFESVDKPIRNPVLWERIDRAIEVIESAEPSDIKQSRTIDSPIEATEPPNHPSPIHEDLPATVPVVDFSFYDEPEVAAIPAPELVPIQNLSPSTPSLFSDDEDDSGDDDDLFGEPVSYRKRVIPFSPVVVEDVVVQVTEEAHVELEEVEIEIDVGVDVEPDAEQQPSTDYLFSLDTSDSESEHKPSVEIALHHESAVVEVEVEVEVIEAIEVEFEEVPEVNAQGDELGFCISMDLTEPIDSIDEPEPFYIDVIPVENVEVIVEEVVEESNIFDLQQPESNTGEKATALDVEVVEAIEITTKPLTTPVAELIPDNQPPINKPPSDVLEPNREIITEMSSYNELSEWTLANEGFRTKRGDFVPLAPPRELMNKHMSSNGKLRKATTEKLHLTESDNLFSSVRNIFKKK